MGRLLSLVDVAACTARGLGKQTAQLRSSKSSGDLRLARGRSTCALLINAATDVLRESGYSATSMRAVAELARVQFSLVHYHFGSKRRLLVTVLEDLTGELLTRRQAMFADDRPFAEQWLSACEYLREGSKYAPR